MISGLGPSVARTVELVPVKREPLPSSMLAGYGAIVLAPTVICHGWVLSIVDAAGPELPAAGGDEDAR